MNSLESLKEFHLKRLNPEGRFYAVQLDLKGFYGASESWSMDGLVVRRVRGSRMRDLQGLFDEFSAVLQFPSYFGNNGGAFNECIQDIPEWLPFGYGYVLAIENSDQIQNDEDWLDYLVRVLKNAAISYTESVKIGPGLDRAPVPFHVVLHENPGNEEPFKEWENAGAILQRVQLVQKTVQIW